MVPTLLLQRLTLQREWRLFVVGVLVTAFLPLVLHTGIHSAEDIAQSGRRLPVGVPYRVVPPEYNFHGSRSLDSTGHSRETPTQEISPTSILDAANQAEQEILQFFQGETRALNDGVPFGGTEERSSNFLAKRLARRIALCQSSSTTMTTNCTLKVVFVGSAQTSGRDNFYNQSYPFLAEERLKSVAKASGLQLKVLNHALDSDLSREGPQTTHMCIGNLVGTDVDVVAWDLDGNMQAKPSAQVEAFLRWTVALQPAMIMINRGGPHQRSRRGKKRAVVNLGPGHDAFVFGDDPNDMPEPQQEAYRGSKEWKEQWEEGRNSFWETIFQMYRPFVDIAAIDPLGGIHHLDHLAAFSNQAFEAEKVLPLVDCGKKHPPPCNLIPDGVQKHLTRANLTAADIPKDDGGAICWSQVGCRHAWCKFLYLCEKHIYQRATLRPGGISLTCPFSRFPDGGKRSHQFRAELNALPIVRSLQSAARILSLNPSELKSDSNMRALVETKSLPPPEFCSEKFCSLVPTCITSYVPNLGLDLGAAIVPELTSPVDMPRKGASHFADDPEHQIQNLDLRLSPLGYIDRKFAYHLSAQGGKKQTQKTEHWDASTTAVSFSMTGPGPIVLCEPPCFIDACSKNRKRPLVNFATLELDGVKLELPKHPPSVVEVGGPFCKVIVTSAEAGNHSLRITTKVAAPEHVMFSHVITFS